MHQCNEVFGEIRAGGSSLARPRADFLVLMRVVKHGIIYTLYSRPSVKQKKHFRYAQYAITLNDSVALPYAEKNFWV